jgi:phosphoribosylanthranilate isomerase
MVKICGITNHDDALASVDAGADALGFNFFARSPRYISPAVAGEISSLLGGGVYKVGVFVNESIDTIVSIAATSGIDAVQLHGDEAPAFVDMLKLRTQCDVIKALRVSRDFEAPGVELFNSDGVLLDGFSVNAFGGTGETFDWEIARQVGTRVERLWLAGGLTAANVAVAVRVVGPYGVDACSSLESEPGIKDSAKVREFIKEAKRQ